MWKCKICNTWQCPALAAAVSLVLLLLLLASLAFAGTAHAHHVGGGKVALVYEPDFKLIGGAVLIAWLAWASRAPRK